MSVKLTILCENTVERVDPFGLIGEYGFACHLQTDAGNFLFDCGSGEGLLKNAATLGIDLNQLQGIVLSHGHRDHTGGLRQVLELTGPRPVYAHPDIFSCRYSSNEKERRKIGIPYSRKELEGLGATFHLSREAQRISPTLSTSGEIHRSHPTSGDRNLVLLNKQGQLKSDPLLDDLSLIISTDHGLVILLGCAHAGLLNIIEQAFKTTGQDRVHLLLGGTHLKFSTEEQMERTLDQLMALQIERFGAAHCTGFHQAQKIAERFGDRFFHASVGTEVII